MMRQPILLALSLACLAQSGKSVSRPCSDDRLVLAALPVVQTTGVPHIGINLGSWNSWGSEQLASNIVKNPGFEAVLDGALATVVSSDHDTLVLNGVSVLRKDGFWDGGTIDVRTGLTAGQRSGIAHSSANGQRLQLKISSPVALASGDVVALNRSSDASAPTQWRISQAVAKCPLGAPRPGSGGAHSLILCSQDGQDSKAEMFLDETTARSGKMLPVNGSWLFSFWARSLRQKTTIRVEFARSGSRPFFLKEFQPGQAWRHISIAFKARDDGPDGALQLQFIAAGSGQIALDDVSLRAAADANFPFRREVVTALRLLRPGYLRDWQGQLGDTVANRLADTFARRASRYRSEKVEDATYGYSIPEFLRLCQRVGANPWLVLPTTAADREYERFGAYLAHADRTMQFGEVVVEFGNENWNPLFEAAGIPDVHRHAEAAARAFSALRRGAGNRLPLRTAVNAAFSNPDTAAALISSNASDLVAVAPYFAYDLPAGAGDAQIYALLFRPGNAFGRLANAANGQHHELAVYEVNLHTVGGSASAPERNRFVLSSDAGVALAMRLIQALNAGIRRQCVYSLAGFDAYTSDRSQFVQLWGVVRDLAGPPQLRASGYVTALLNRTVQPEMHRVTSPGACPVSGIEAAAFRGNQSWSAVIVSGKNDATHITLALPVRPGETTPKDLVILQGTLTNQGTDTPVHFRRVQMTRQLNSASIDFVLPPRSLAVLTSDPSAAGLKIGGRL